MITSPNTQSYLEVAAVFKEVEDRDFVVSRAVSLGDLIHPDGHPKAGIRLDVPAFLLPNFKDLNSYAFNVGRTHGKKAKTHIKFDDVNTSLILELRLPGSDHWLRISPTKARELTTEAAVDELGRLQHQLRARNTRRSEEQDDPWSESVNRLPLGQCPQGSSWQPPERDAYSRIEFGGQR